MSIREFHLDLVLVFFIYGLAFFSMGVALLLETSRTPRLAERRVLRPLAVFGILHGLHEWMEILIMQAEWFDHPYPEVVVWLRVVLLAASFLPLTAFASIVLFSSQRRPRLALESSLGLLVIYLLAAVINANISPLPYASSFDLLARYIIAIPGALFAALALYRRGTQLPQEGQSELVRYFFGAAVGFGLYGLTQLVVSPMDVFPAQFVNTKTFQDLFGFPVQVVRAGMAIIITVNLILAIQKVEMERQIELLSAQQARLEALEQIRKDLIERETMRRDLLRHIVVAQEDERARIARELHDETAQILTAISLDLATLRSILPKVKDSGLLLERLQNYSREISQGLYRLVHDLRPAQLDDLGLVAALEHFVENESKRTHVQIILEAEGNRQRFDPLVETVLFRVAQEALANVTRHAQSGKATVQLSFSHNQVTLRVIDNGVGFNPGEIYHPPRGWGLAGMRERTEALGGVFQIESLPGKGTTVMVTVPVLDFGTVSNPETMNYENHTLDVS